MPTRISVVKWHTELAIVLFYSKTCLLSQSTVKKSPASIRQSFVAEKLNFLNVFQPALAMTSVLATASLSLARLASKECYLQ